MEFLPWVPWVSGPVRSTWRKFYILDISRLDMVHLPWHISHVHNFAWNLNFSKDLGWTVFQESKDFSLFHFFPQSYFLLFPKVTPSPPPFFLVNLIYLIFLQTFHNLYIQINMEYLLCVMYYYACICNFL